MPTPFTHLVTAAKLLADESLPDDLHALLAAERGAFLLGNIAADARVSSGILREQTHFYSHNQPIQEHPWRVMVGTFPQLLRPTSTGARAFVAGYVAHLALDEVWSIRIVRPYFGEASWATRPERFIWLNALLVAMDERDYRQIDEWQRSALLNAKPSGWTPFMGDGDLSDWRDFVGRQLPPGGESQTLTVIGERMGFTPEALQALIKSDEAMLPLRANVPPDVTAQAEAEMAERARLDLLRYWEESAAS